MVEIKNGKVVLRKNDGGEVTVPLQKLSQADREYLASVQDAVKSDVEPVGARLHNIDANAMKDIEDLHRAIAEATNEKVDLTSMLFLVVGFDLLWDDKNKLRHGIVQVYLKRLPSLSRSAIADWARLTVRVELKKGDLSIASLHLVAQNGVFNEDRFDEAAFKSLCQQLAVKKPGRK